MKLDQDGRTSLAASVVALGMFDGVHIAHQVLLQKARKTARREGVPLVVQTFADNPLCLLNPTHCPPMLTTLQERAGLMQAQGVDILYAPPFTPAMRDLPPEDFVGELVRRWHPVAVVVGYNYTFGQKGAGTPALLAALGDALGFQTIIVPVVRLGGKAVSATGIRQVLACGGVLPARYMLGRPYARDVDVARLSGNRLVLTPLPDGKQALPAGLYRALLEDGKHAYPILLRMKNDGGALCRLPRTAETAARATIRFIAERP